MNFVEAPLVVTLEHGDEHTTFFMFPYPGMYAECTFDRFGDLTFLDFQNTDRKTILDKAKFLLKDKNAYVVYDQEELFLKGGSK